MITSEEIAKMSREERWKALELLQESLEEEEPAWLEGLLAERKTRLEGGEETSALDEVENRYRMRGR